MHVVYHICPSRTTNAENKILEQHHDTLPQLITQSKTTPLLHFLPLHSLHRLGLSEIRVPSPPIAHVLLNFLVAFGDFGVYGEHPRVHGRACLGQGRPGVGNLLFGLRLRPEDAVHDGRGYFRTGSSFRAEKLSLSERSYVEEGCASCRPDGVRRQLDDGSSSRCSCSCREFVGRSVLV